MANNFFTFKKFTLYNGGSGLKIGTDGVLLGAWTEVPSNCTALDIGCGTGLIAFMLSQKGAVQVDAIDIYREAFENTEYNLAQNKTIANITPVHSSLQMFRSEKKYTVIVCNPPWFVNSLKNANSAKSMARHADSLPAYELFKYASQLLADDGFFCVIIPYELERHYSLCAAQWGLSPQKKLYVRPKPQKEINRVLIRYKANVANCMSDELCIEYSEGRIFTDAYKNLTKDFYLNF